MPKPIPTTNSKPEWCWRCHQMIPIGEATVKDNSPARPNGYRFSHYHKGFCPREDRAVSLAEWAFFPWGHMNKGETKRAEKFMKIINDRIARFDDPKMRRIYQYVFNDFRVYCHIRNSDWIGEIYIDFPDYRSTGFLEAIRDDMKHYFPEFWEFVRETGREYAWDRSIGVTVDEKRSLIRISLRLRYGG